jgi:methyl-accepting chemotaxis protein
MTTKTASGASKNTDTAAATKEAMRAALDRLSGGRPKLGFVFCSASHDLARVIAVAKDMAAGCEFIGCQTAGEFTEVGQTTGGLALMLVDSDSMMVECAAAQGVRSDVNGVAKAITSGFAEFSRKATAQGLGLSTTVLLVDGLAGTGETLVKQVLAGTRLFQQVVGGAAGDDGKFKMTAVGGNKTVGPDCAAAAHVFDAAQWGVGVDHGLKSKTKPMTVTKAKGAVLYEIDNRKAFEVYKEYATAKGVELTAANTNQFLIGNELGVFFLNEVHHARAPVGVGPSGELQLVADIAEGAQVCILDGEPDSMVAACGRAAEQARTNLAGSKAAGILVFDCICRGMILGRQFQREIDAVKAVFPETPIVGFLTYGEIARFRGRLDGWHNTTAVVAAIPA